MLEMNEIADVAEAMKAVLIDENHDPSSVASRVAD